MDRRSFLGSIGAAGVSAAVTSKMASLTITRDVFAASDADMRSVLERLRASWARKGSVPSLQMLRAVNRLRATYGMAPVLIEAKAVLGPPTRPAPLRKICRTGESMPKGTLIQRLRKRGEDECADRIEALGAVERAAIGVVGYGCHLGAAPSVADALKPLGDALSQPKIPPRQQVEPALELRRLEAILVAAKAFLERRGDLDPDEKGEMALDHLEEALSAIAVPANQPGSERP